MTLRNADTLPDDTESQIHDSAASLQTMLGTRTMTETGEPFEVTALADPAVRYTLEPVLRYGRTNPGGRLVRAPWSTWSYQLKDHPAVAALPVDNSGPRDRPRHFILDFGDDPPGRLHVRLTE